MIKVSITHEGDAAKNLAVAYDGDGGFTEVVIRPGDTHVAELRPGRWITVMETTDPSLVAA